jgi:hypothetical protein
MIDHMYRTAFRFLKKSLKTIIFILKKKNLKKKKKNWRGWARRTGGDLPLPPPLKGWISTPTLPLLVSFTKLFLYLFVFKHK